MRLAPWRSTGSTRKRGRQEARRSLPRRSSGWHRQRQAGPDRRELGIAGPGDPHRVDGQQRGPPRTARRPRRDDRCDARVAPFGRPSWPSRPGCATTGSSSARRYRVSGSRRRVPSPGGPLRLSVAFGPDRGRDGRQGHRRFHRGSGDPAQRGHRRYDSGLAHPRTRRAARARSRGRPADPPVDGLAIVHSPGDGLPGLRPNDHRRSSRRWPSRSRVTQEQMPIWRETHPASRR